MKKFNLKVLAVAITMAVGGFALTGIAVAHPGAGLEEIKQELNLTADQEAKIKPIFQKRKEAFKTIKQDESLSREAKREKMEVLRAETRKELAGVLNNEQLQKLDSKMENRARGKGKGEGKGDHMARMQRMSEELNLSDAQKSKVRTVMQNAKAERELILEANNGDRKAAKDELKAHRQKTKSALRAVLTAEQAAKFDAMKDRKGKGHGKENKGKKDGSGEGKQKGGKERG